MAKLNYTALPIAIVLITNMSPECNIVPMRVSEVSLLENAREIRTLNLREINPPKTETPSSPVRVLGRYSASPGSRFEINDDKIKITILNALSVRNSPCALFAISNDSNELLTIDTDKIIYTASKRGKTAQSISPCTPNLTFFIPTIPADWNGESWDLQTEVIAPDSNGLLKIPPAQCIVTSAAFDCGEKSEGTLLVPINSAALQFERHYKIAFIKDSLTNKRTIRR